METIKLKHLPDDTYVTDTFITTDEWLSVLQAAEKEGKASQIEALLRFFRMPSHKGTCSAVAKQNGTNSESERSYITNFGMFTRKALGNRFRVESSDSEEDTYWPIPMLGKNLGKKGFEWTVRPELADALRSCLLDRLLKEYRGPILKEGLDSTRSYERYKWKHLSSLSGKPIEEVVRFLASKDCNFVDRRYAGATLFSLVESSPEAVFEAFGKLLQEKPLNVRIQEFSAAAKAITPAGKTSFGDERTAAAFLACSDPQNYTPYTSTIYETYCKYLGIPSKYAGQKYEHFLELLKELVPIEKEDEELMAALHRETDPYFWSDMLNAQDVLWQMNYFMDSNIKAKKMQKYTWIPFYKELADKLLAYKDDRLALLDFIYGEIPDGYRNYFHDKDGDPNTDVDPYTVFAMFNRNITDKQRVEICGLFKERFAVEAPLPQDFKGIPIWNNMHSQMFGFRDKRDEQDIENIWRLFEAVMTGQDWKDVFTIVEKQFMAGAAMVTSGMYWTRPDDFLPLDQNTVKYVKQYGVTVPIQKTRIDAASYADVCAQVRQLMESNVIPEKTFVELSHVAGGYDLDPNDPSDNMEPSFYDKIVATLRSKKNIILQGAPGTGKTYAIPEVVTRLCGEQIDFHDREEVMAAYKRLSSAGRVVFTTFHQSMDYEDFIEGLKPKADGSGNITYEVEPGIFKTLCIEAAKPIIHDNQINLGTDPAIWKVSLEGTGDNETRRDCLRNGYIRVGYDEPGPLLDGEIPVGSGRTILDAMINKMAIGDIVMSCYSSRTVDAIGVITGDYEWRDEFRHYKRVRKVNWLVKGINEDIFAINGNKTMTLSTVYRLNNVTVDDVLAILKKHDVGNQTSTEKNDNPYVLVVDEINRGNISKIFGELITLIEPEKRSDGKMPLSVVLPYSKDRFEVPSNVYIIGTMNTADRSLTQFDYAMRRRFRFITLMYGLVDINEDGEHVFDEELFRLVSNLFVSNFDEYVEDEYTRPLPADCFSPEFRPEDMWIGPSYFIHNPSDPAGKVDSILYEIIPTLRQYIADGVFINPDEAEKVIDKLMEIVTAE